MLTTPEERNEVIRSATATVACGGPSLVSSRQYRLAKDVNTLAEENALLTDRVKECEQYLASVCEAAGEDSWDNLYVTVSCARDSSTNVAAALDLAEIPVYNVKMSRKLPLEERVTLLAASRDHWLANHNNQVALKAAVLDRPDLGDRAKRVEALVEEKRELERKLDEANATLNALNGPSGFGRALLENAHDFMRAIRAEEGRYATPAAATPLVFDPEAVLAALKAYWADQVASPEQRMRSALTVAVKSAKRGV